MESKKPKWTMVDTLYWLGAVMVSAALGLCHLAVGLASAGVFCLAGAWLVDKGRGGGGTQ